MKSKIVSLFLRREHLILLSKMLQLTETSIDQDVLVYKIDQQNQKSENRILKTERWPQQDLDYFQNTFLQIANLAFSYYKLHFPVNSALQIKEHIKFIQCVKQINYGGVTIEEIFKQQRTRLASEISRITKSVKLTDEPIMPKIMNYKIDLNYIAQIQEKYFYAKNLEYMAPYIILNLKPHIPKTTSRPNNKEHYQSITSYDDIPSFQFMNQNLIQPILNYDTFKNTFEYRLNKLMQRNQQVSYTIKKYQSKVKSFEGSFDDSLCGDAIIEVRKQFYDQIKLQNEKRMKNGIFDSSQKQLQLIENCTSNRCPPSELNDLETDYVNENGSSYQKCQRFFELSLKKNQMMEVQSQQFKYSPKISLENSMAQGEIQNTCPNIPNVEQANQMLEVRPTISQLELQQSVLLHSNTVRPQRKFISYQEKMDRSDDHHSHKFFSIPQQNINLQENEETQETQKVVITNRNAQQRSLDRITLKPIIYQSLRLKESKKRLIQRQNHQDSQFPYVRDSLPKVAQSQNEFEQIKEEDQKLKQDLQQSINNQNTSKVKRIAIQQIQYSKGSGNKNTDDTQQRFQTNANEKDESTVREILFFQKKNNNMRNQLQNQLVLLTRSDQILTSLIANGQIKGSELYQQLLLPIKVSSSAKFLTPKSNNLISRTKFKKMQQESKMFSLK